MSPVDIVALAAGARVAIAGGPRTGKTTLSHELFATPRPADEVRDLGWSEASAEVATWFDAPGPWVVEGVSVARALRKWMAAHPNGKPCDVAILLDVAHVELTKGQSAMAKGCATVWSEILPALQARGVRILQGSPRVLTGEQVALATRKAAL